MKALSIKQPWAWLIVNGIKDIENRTWKTKFRGKFLVHASKGVDVKRYNELLDKGVKLPPISEFKRGGIVGEAEIVDCVEKSDSPWFLGPIGFVLINGKELPFKEYKGQLNFFEVKE